MPWYDSYRGLTLSEFLERIDQEGLFWVTKRLSGNDTGATGGHQAGFYLPRWFFEKVFPVICVKDRLNPRSSFPCFFPDQDLLCSNIQAIYYNNKIAVVDGVVASGSRNEFRLTNWGGRNSSPVQTQENTGAIAVVAIKMENTAPSGLVWVCDSVAQENLVESWIGDEVVPGEVYGKGVSCLPAPAQLEKTLASLIQPEWLQTFPSGKEIFNAVVGAIPFRENLSDDAILIKRRKLEVSLFHAIERKHVIPTISSGFKTMEAFMEVALQVANRRKARTGQSLELNLQQIFLDRKLRFETQAITENKKKPDFLFPSKSDYDNVQFPVTKLHMLAAKTCCKERWRQVLSEANRIQTKHLFTLQEGTTESQLCEMYEHGIILVVPKDNIVVFPNKWRNKIYSLSSFVSEMRTEQLDLK